jgi:hypothetical protein
VGNVLNKHGDNMLVAPSVPAFPFLPLVAMVDAIHINREQFSIEKARSQLENDSFWMDLGFLSWDILPLFIHNISAFALREFVACKPQRLTNVVDYLICQ